MRTSVRNDELKARRRVPHMTVELPFICTFSPTGSHCVCLVLAQDYTVLHLSSPCSRVDGATFEAVGRLRDDTDRVGNYCCDAEKHLRDKLKSSAPRDNADVIVTHCANTLAGATLRLVFGKIMERSRISRMREHTGKRRGLAELNAIDRKHRAASILQEQVSKACGIPYVLRGGWYKNGHPPFRVEAMVSDSGPWDSYSLRVATPAANLGYMQIATITYDRSLRLFQVKPAETAREVAPQALCTSDGHCLCCHGRTYSSGKRHRQSKKHVDNVLLCLRKIHNHFRVIGRRTHG